jgi:hypothetical protein
MNASSTAITPSPLCSLATSRATVPAPRTIVLPPENELPATTA